MTYDEYLRHTLGHNYNAAGERFDPKEGAYTGNMYRGYTPTAKYVNPGAADMVPYAYNGYTPNFTIVDDAPKASKSAKNSRFGRAFDKAKDIGSDIMFNVDNFFNPTEGGKISYGLGTEKTGGLGKAGLNLGKHNLGKYATGISGVMQGLDAIGGLSEMSDLNADADTLTSQILASASGNPLLHSYLTADDLALLGKLQRGNYDAAGDIGDATSNLGNLLSGTLSGVASGAMGGIPGMVVGGIGGLINSGIDNINSATTNNTARLEALYQNLLNAEQQYKSMRRPNFTGLGIQQRYQNMYA